MCIFSIQLKQAAHPFWSFISHYAVHNRCKEYSVTPLEKFLIQIDEALDEDLRLDKIVSSTFLIPQLILSSCLQSV